MEAGYNRYRNPYHNNAHAADVLQTMHYMLSQTGLMVRDLEVLVGTTCCHRPILWWVFGGYGGHYMLSQTSFMVGVWSLGYQHLLCQTNLRVCVC